MFGLNIGVYHFTRDSAIVALYAEVIMWLLSGELLSESEAL